MTTSTQIQLIGHTWAIDLLKQQREAGRVAQSLLLTGPPNVGKATLARYLAQSLNCQQPSDAPCGVCLACQKLASGNHPDVRILDEAETLKIEQIRELQHELALSPLEGNYRVAALCNFERATTSAANALLKTLEEPPSHVILILTATDAKALLSTIVSRCQMLTLRPLPAETVLDALQTVWHAPPEKAELLTQLAAGRLGWAVTALTDGELLTRREQYLTDLQELLRMHRDARLEYAKTLSRDSAHMEETLLMWLSMWRDMLLLQAGSQTRILNLDWEPQLRQIAQRCDLDQIKAMVLRLRTALTNLDYNVNSRLNLESVLLKFPKQP